MMYDESNIRFIDSKTKSNRRNHRLILPCYPFTMDTRSLVRIQISMVAANFETSLSTKKIIDHIQETMANEWWTYCTNFLNHASPKPNKNQNKLYVTKSQSFLVN